MKNEGGLQPQILEPRLVKLTVRSGVDIKRLIPHREIRTIGAWCFLDYYGPTAQADAMSVGAHPHTGLQTASWLFSGEIEHRDSLGTRSLIRPGELNLMTAGHGIAHSELSMNREVDLHGVQLWIALPSSARDMRADFAHHAELPLFSYSNLQIRLFAGAWLGHDAAVDLYSPLMGAEIASEVETVERIPVEARYEYGFLSVAGDVSINGIAVAVGQLFYLPTSASEIDLQLGTGSRIVVIGGEPFTEDLVMWWNFIGRSHEEIVQMRSDWESKSERFAPFLDQRSERIPAPALPNVRLHPRPGKRST